MPERPWSKDWRAGWRDERLDDCGAAAVALRPCLVAHVVDVGEDGTGWVMNLDGRPMSVAQLGRLVRHDEATALAGLEQLAAVKIAVRREDGCWGIVGWQKTQESPEAARVRRHRALHVTPDVTPPPPAAVTPTVTVTDRGTEDRGTEEQRRRGADDAEQTPAAAAVIPIVSRPTVDCATMPPARARAVRPHQDLPPSGGPVLAHALATELAALYRPAGRCFGPANPRHLELAAEVLAVAPGEGDDRGHLEQERFREVVGFCRDFAQICGEDPKQAEFWRPTMLSTRPATGKTIAAWDMLTRSVSAWRDRRTAERLAAEAEAVRHRRAREEAARPVERADPKLLADLTAGLLSRLPAGRPRSNPDKISTAEPAALPETTPTTFADIRRRLRGEENK